MVTLGASGGIMPCMNTSPWWRAGWRYCGLNWASIPARSLALIFS